MADAELLTQGDKIIGLKSIVGDIDEVMALNLVLDVRSLLAAPDRIEALVLRPATDLVRTVKSWLTS